MNYQLVNSLVKYFKYCEVNYLKNVLYSHINDYPKDIINSAMTFSSTHDISRIINILGSNDFNSHSEWGWDFSGDDREWQRNYKLTKEQYEYGKKLYKTYLYSEAFLPGNLSIFYGDEVGMQGMGNLFNRRTFPWHNSDIDFDIFSFVMKIGEIRNKESFLRDADLEVIDEDDKYFSFKRIGEKEESLTLINRINDRVDKMIQDEYKKEDIVYRLNDSDKNRLDANGGLVLKKWRK